MLDDACLLSQAVVRLPTQTPRLKTLMERFGLAEEEVRHRMKQTDANRTAYIRQVYGHHWTHPSHYDLVLDTGRLGYDVAASVILAALPGRSR